MSNLSPIKLLPARERVAASLRKAILFRDLAEGQSITLDMISKQLGVSMMPVREAFQILANEGLIVLHPNKGAVVCGITAKFITDHYEVRSILEAEAAGCVCRINADLTDVVNIHENARREMEIGETSSYSDLNQGFHMAIWSACGNLRLKSILSTLWNGLSMGRMVTEKQYATISFAEHEEILSHMKARDEKEAMSSMRRHILRSMEDMLTRYQ